MLRVPPVSIEAYLQCRFFGAFPSYFSLQTYQLLSLLPDGLIGFICSTTCFWGHSPPEPVLDRFFFSLRICSKIPYQSPELPGSYIAWFKGRWLIELSIFYSASGLIDVIFYRSCLSAPVAQSKVTHLLVGPVEPRQHGSAWRLLPRICRLA